MEHLTIEQQIRSEIYRAFELLGADRHLLAAVGFWGDSLDDESVLDLLKEWSTDQARRVVEALPLIAPRQTSDRKQRPKAGKVLAFPKAIDSGA